MTAVAVVLAGGKGTRSADPRRAKLAQEVGGRSLMQWHVDLLAASQVRRCLVVAGHLGEQVQELCDGLPGSRSVRSDPLEGNPGSDVAVDVIHEQEQSGTVAALRLAAQNTDAQEFVVILGDILMSLPLDHVLDQWRSSGRRVGVVVHPSTHPQDSDAAFPRHDGTVLVVPKSQARDHVPNMSSAGLFLITRAGLDRYGHLRDFGSDVLPAAAQEHDLAAIVTSHYLKDTGTPDRLESAQRDIAAGAFRRRGELTPRAALFLDRDGVINPTEPEFHGPEGYALLPGVAGAIREANRAGLPVIVLTNQPHIAKGFMGFDDHERVRARMDMLLAQEGAFVDDYLFCPHHPDGGFEGEVPELKRVCECRKPAPGLAREAAARHGIDLSHSAMVGDSDRDRGLALTTGMTYVHVGTRISGGSEEDCYVQAAEAITHATEVLSC